MFTYVQTKIIFGHRNSYPFYMHKTFLYSIFRLIFREKQTFLFKSFHRISTFWSLSFNRLDNTGFKTLNPISYVPSRCRFYEKNMHHKIFCASKQPSRKNIYIIIDRYTALVCIINIFINKAFLLVETKLSETDTL